MVRGEHIVVLGTVVVVTWNCFFAPPGECVSDVLRRWSVNPLVPFLFGMLMGHIFWNR